MSNTNNNKQWCDKCEFWINPEGHDQRCRVSEDVVEVTQAMRHVAWVGDTFHRLDIKAVALFMRIPFPDCDKFVENYVTNKSQREYMWTLYPDMRGSAHRLGTVFESRYFGDFRITYLSTLFPSVSEQVLDAVPLIDVEYLLGRNWFDTPD